MKNFVSVLLRFLTVWAFNALCLWVCHKILPSFTVTALKEPLIVAFLSIGFVFTVVNVLVRPFLMLLAFPVMGATAGILSLFVNALTFVLTDRFSPQFHISNYWVALAGGIVFTVINVILTTLFPLDDDMSYFDVLGNRLRKKYKKENDGKRGLIFLEIDGCAYNVLNHALKANRMPFLAELIQSGRYKLQEYDCGVPSQTSSCQSGIMYGNNHDICAFRWYDKKRKKMITSCEFQDAEWMEKRILSEKAEGLLQGGLSVNNIMGGYAAEQIFTMCGMKPRNDQDRKDRNLDLYLFSLQPYLLTKALIWTIIDIFTELMQNGWAVLTHKYPRANRFEGWYPLVRAATNVFLRDLSTALLINDMYRGGPAAYTTFIGHDEIAHHSGPYSFEAMDALTQIDRSIRKIFNAADAIASEPDGRSYDIVILADHGQAFGPTFKQRYGEELSEVINRLSGKEEVKVTGISNRADNTGNIRAAIATFSSFSTDSAKNANPLSEKIYRQFDKALNSYENTDEIHTQENSDSDVFVLASGNLVNVYFTASENKMTVDEIDQKYPGLLEGILAQEGVGLIIVNQGDASVAIGKKGMIDLKSGECKGENPLNMYGNAQTRLSQMQYLAEFPSGGDIVIFSTVYEDGTVAAFEELIGSHGGMGGDQTAPFILHPYQIKVSDTIQNANEIYHFLRKAREVCATPDDAQSVPSKEDWKFSKLIDQIKDTKRWTPLVQDAFLFSPSAYKKIASDATMNGPAFLIFVLSGLVTALSWAFVSSKSIGVVIGLLIWAISWLVYVLGAKMASALLREKTYWSNFVRSIFVCSAVDLLWLLILIPNMKSVWISVMFFIKLVAVSFALYSVAGLKGKKQWLIVLLSFVLQAIAGGIIFLMIVSILYPLNPALGDWFLHLFN